MIVSRKKFLALLQEYEETVDGYDMMLAHEMAFSMYIMKKYNLDPNFMREMFNGEFKLKDDNVVYVQF